MRMNTKNISLKYFARRLVFRHEAGRKGGWEGRPPSTLPRSNHFPEIYIQEIEL